MSSRTLAALCAALIAALLSLGGASLVIADQPAGKGGGNDQANANWHASDQATDPAATPAPAEPKQNRGQVKKHQSAPAPKTKSTPPKPTTGAGSHSTATSGPGNSSQGCDGSHNSDTGHGANHSGPYDNTCDGSPSGNGNGNGQATGKPCAGCVGNADDKNPKGQYPNGSDHNAGYECDRNHGIGRTNPAHTGCRQPETGVTPPAEQNGNKNDQAACPSATSLGNALKHSAALALKAVALMHPELKKLAERVDAKDCSPASNQNQNANNYGHGKITICHATGSATNPFVQITISVNGLHGHGKHADDIVPAPAEGCPKGAAATPQVHTEQPPANPPTTETTTPPATLVAPLTTPVTPGMQAVLGVRVSGTSTPASTTAPASKVLGVRASGTAPAASAPAAAQAARAASSAGGSLPFTGTDALLVLFLGCVALIAGITIQRLTTRPTD